jgi:prevent-host-death family protein
MSAATSITTMSSRLFNQDVGGAKRAADAGPVVITDRGRPAYVLMRHEDWQRLAGGRQSIRAALDMPGIEDIEFEPPRLSGPLARPADWA